jgi:hypothetical protein
VKGGRAIPRGTRETDMWSLNGFLTFSLYGTSNNNVW